MTFGYGWKGGVIHRRGAEDAEKEEEDRKVEEVKEKPENKAFPLRPSAFSAPLR